MGQLNTELVLSVDNKTPKQSTDTAPRCLLILLHLILIKLSLEESCLKTIIKFLRRRFIGQYGGGKSHLTFMYYCSVSMIKCLASLKKTSVQNKQIPALTESWLDISIIFTKQRFENKTRSVRT